MAFSRPSQPTPWLTLASVLLGSRVWLLLVGWVSKSYLPRGQFFGTPGRVEDFFRRWDAAWYCDIADGGYRVSTDGQSSVAFFPGFPALINLLTRWTHDSAHSGILISAVSFLVAGYLLFRLAVEELAEQSPWLNAAEIRNRGLWAVALFAFGPVSFFFTAAYSEALFLLLCLSCMTFARNGQFFIAGLTAAFAAFTRNAGVFLAVFLVLEAWGQKRFEGGKWSRIGTLIICGFPVLGTLGYMTYLWIHFGDPLLFSKVQAQWGRRLTFPWEAFRPGHLGGFPFGYRIWFLATVAVVVSGLVAGWRQHVSRPVWTFGALLFLLAISANHLESIPRYSSVVIPLYLAVAFLEKDSHRRWLFAGCATAFTITTFMFVNGYWMT